MREKRADRIILGAKEILTLSGSKGPRRGREMNELGLIEDGAIAIQGDRILAVGPTEEVLEEVEIAPGETEEIQAQGKVVLPGLIDPHTHLLYGGHRAEELDLRLQGVPYLEILKKGGGILKTVEMTRSASNEELFQATQGRLLRLLMHGVTTVEIKSGYGLTVEDELRSLEIINELSQGPITIAPTFLGAHAIPLEYREGPDSYVDLVIQKMLPEVAERRLAVFCDVFCEEGVFTVDQSRRILKAAESHGLKLKIHADEMNALGGAELAAELKATSAEHLLHITPKGMEEMAKTGVIAVLLPGTAFYLGEPYAPAREMVASGIPVALSTDFNPGSSPIESPWIIMGLAVLKMGLTTNEAIVAFTINAAHALGLGEWVGSLEVGKVADILILDMETYKEIPYYFGSSKVMRVIKGGADLF